LRDSGFRATSARVETGGFMSSEEVKTENSSQEVKTEAKTYSDEQFKGLLADKEKLIEGLVPSLGIQGDKYVGIQGGKKKSKITMSKDFVNVVKS
jgi:hypothetical protein